MGACSSSHRSTDAVVSNQADVRPFDLDSDSTDGSSLVRYFADLQAMDESRDFHRARWRRHPAGIQGRSLEQERQRRMEIENLQRSLAAMEDFFQSLLGQAQLYMEAMDPSGGGGNNGPPPASGDALDKLPRIALTCHDMEDEDNRSCGICCETQNVGDAVTRLPCGHVFHGACIEAWLNRHCTCPICRYELATDDESYEPGRIARMATRKLMPSEFASNDEAEECCCEETKPEVKVVSRGEEQNDTQSRVES